MRCAKIDLTTNASGAGTALSSYPISGEILHIRYPTGLLSTGSVDYTFTRATDGGTILALTNQASPWEFSPRLPIHSLTGGTTAYNTGVGPVMSDMGPPCDDYLQVVVAQGAASKTDRIYVYYEEQD